MPPLPRFSPASPATAVALLLCHRPPCARHVPAMCHRPPSLSLVSRVLVISSSLKVQLEFEGLSYRLADGTYVLSDASGVVASDEITVVMGPSVCSGRPSDPDPWTPPQPTPSHA